MPRHIQLLPGEQITLADGTVVSAVLRWPVVAKEPPGSVPESEVEHPIDHATRIVGTQNAIAKELGVSKGAVSLWKAPGNNVPAKHCPLIEEMTHGAVRCEDLRPDIRWDVLRIQPKLTSHSSLSGLAVEDAPDA